MRAWGIDGKERVMSYVLLAMAILFEVLATSMLKMTEGFTRFWPSVVVVTGYGGAFWCLSKVLESVKVGVAYAVWSAAGIVLVSLVGVLVYKQKIDAVGLVGMGLIVAGVVVLMGFSKIGAGH